MPPKFINSTSTVNSSLYSGPLWNTPPWTTTTSGSYTQSYDLEYERLTLFTDLTDDIWVEEFSAEELDQIQAFYNEELSKYYKEMEKARPNNNTKSSTEVLTAEDKALDDLDTEMCQVLDRFRECLIVLTAYLDFCKKKEDKLTAQIEDLTSQMLLASISANDLLISEATLRIPEIESKKAIISHKIAELNSRIDRAHYRVEVYNRYYEAEEEKILKAKIDSHNTKESNTLKRGVNSEVLQKRAYLNNFFKEKMSLSDTWEMASDGTVNMFYEAEDHRYTLKYDPDNAEFYVEATDLS